MLTLGHHHYFRLGKAMMEKSFKINWPNLGRDYLYLTKNEHEVYNTCFIENKLRALR